VIRRLARTDLSKRAVDVLAYFDRPGTGNGPTEAINGHLEHLRGAALGFRNLTNYIARVPLDSTTSSNPARAGTASRRQTAAGGAQQLAQVSGDRLRVNKRLVQVEHQNLSHGTSQPASPAAEYGGATRAKAGAEGTADYRDPGAKRFGGPLLQP
jgi:hypothetical protein